MQETIRVHVVKYPDRENLVMRYLCPASGKHISRSTGTSKPKEAAKVAAKWEAELQEGRYQQSARMPWHEFRAFFERNAMPTMKRATIKNYSSTINAFESRCRPEKLGDLTTARVTTFATELRKPITRKRKDGTKTTRYLAEASIARHLRHLKAVARWAHRRGLLPAVPVFDMPKRKSGAQRMKGRPITGEEFDRLLKKVPAVVGEDAAESWKFLLRGLWASGLRLGEAMALRWDHQPDGASVRLDDRHSVLVFDAEAQKSGKVQLVPLAPEAVELLAPRARTAGYVFSPLTKEGEFKTRSPDEVGRVIRLIGAKAGIITDASTGRTATAHDLRRSFGFRWSRLLMPAQLMELMRHATIETTMTYYVGQNAASTSAELWRARGNNSGNNPVAEGSVVSANP